MKDTIIKICILISIILITIGIIILLIKDNSKQESTVSSNQKYYSQISNYLKTKYGSITDFEIKDITSKDMVITGDGYDMGIDKEPVVIGKTTSVKANVLNKKYKINFTVSLTIENDYPDEDIYSDNLLDLLMDDDVPKIVSKVKKESMKIDKDIINVDINQPRIKEKNYKTTPNKNEITIETSQMYIKFKDINIKNKLTNPEEIFNFSKQYFIKLMKILKKNDVESNSITIAYMENSSSRNFCTISYDSEKKEVSIYSSDTKERVEYPFDALLN